MERESPTNDSWTGFVARAKHSSNDRKVRIPSPRWAMSMRRRRGRPHPGGVLQFSFVARPPGPQNTTAWMHDGILEMWCPSQNPDTGRNKIARAFGLPHEKSRRTPDAGRRWFRQAVDD